MRCHYIPESNVHRQHLCYSVHCHRNTKTDTMIVLKFSDVLGDNLVASKLYTILLTFNRTYLPERLSYALAIIADVSAKKVCVQCGAGGKPLVGIHQRTAFQVEILTITGLGNTVEQTLLKEFGQDGLIEHILLLCHIELPCPDGFSLFFDFNHSFSAIYYSRILLTLSLSA